MNHLREIVERATKGPWVAKRLVECECDDCGRACETTGKKPAHHDSGWVPSILVVPEDDGDQMSIENARFIAAFNPQVALALLDIWDAAEKLIERGSLEDVSFSWGELKTEWRALDAALNRADEIAKGRK